MSLDMDATQHNEEVFITPCLRGSGESFPCAFEDNVCPKGGSERAVCKCIGDSTHTMVVHNDKGSPVENPFFRIHVLLQNCIKLT